MTMTQSALGEEGLTEMNEEIVKEFRPTVLHNCNRLPVNSLAFSPNGQKLIVASEDAIMAIYKVDEDGSQEKTYENQVEPHGVTLVTYAASNTDVLFATTNGDNTVRRFDTSAAKYCQTYKGAGDEIFNLEMGSGGNTFVTSSLDSSVMLWDLREEAPQLTFPSMEKVINANGKKEKEALVVAIDPESLVVAVGTRDDRSLRLYDLRNVGKGPFSTFKMWPGDPRLKVPYFGYEFAWESLSFSVSGKLLLLNTSGPYVPVFDAFTGEEKFSLEFAHSSCYFSPKAKSNSGVSPSTWRNGAVFTPDSKYILAAGDDGNVRVFESARGKLVTTLQHQSYKGAVGHLKFNPQFMMFVTGRMQTALWLPVSQRELDSHSDSLSTPNPMVVGSGSGKKSGIEIRMNANKRVEEVITQRRSARLREHPMPKRDPTKDDLDKDLEMYMSLRKSRPRRMMAPVRKANTGPVEIPMSSLAPAPASMPISIPIASPATVDVKKEHDSATASASASVKPMPIPKLKLKTNVAGLNEKPEKDQQEKVKPQTPTPTLTVKVDHEKDQDLKPSLKVGPRPGPKSKTKSPKMSKKDLDLTMSNGGATATGAMEMEIEESDNDLK